MLTKSEAQDLRDLSEIVDNLIGRSLNSDIDLIIYGDDVATWPCNQLVYLREKGRRKVKIEDDLLGRKLKELFEGVKLGVYSKQDLKDMIYNGLDT